MSSSILGRGGAALALLFVGLAAGFAACGGKVVFEGPPGGAGGSASTSTGLDSSSSFPSTGVSPDGPSTGAFPDATTGSGPACDCGTVCSVTTSCFGGSNEVCECTGVALATRDCICNAGSDCDAVQACYGSGDQGFGSEECNQCANDTLNSPPCDKLLHDCFGDPACMLVFDCHTQCGWGPLCQETCDIDDVDSTSQNLFVNLLTCFACGPCQQECQGAEVTHYCAPFGGNGG